MGPIIIFDKSALQGLGVDEACWLDHFFISNITPIFYVETLADLSLSTGTRQPEAIVKDIASKSPVQSPAPNIHHHTLLIQDLIGNPVEMSNRPLLSGGQSRKDDKGKIGVVFEHFPEQEALSRWQSGEFSELERAIASKWRAELTGLNFDSRIELARNITIGHSRIVSLQDAKQFSDEFLTQSGDEILVLALEFLDVPSEAHAYIRRRYVAIGKPSLKVFAPYAAYVLKVDIFFYVSLLRGFISKERPSNKIDISYLYYLPFCMAFVSADKLHARTAPLFMELRQEFVSGADMKTALREIDTHFMNFQTEIEREGIVRFAPYPPTLMDNAVTRLWDKFCPPWRSHQAERDKRPARSAEENKTLVDMIMKQEHAPLAETNPGVDEADFMILKRVSPVRRGKWRILPPEVEKR